MIYRKLSDSGDYTLGNAKQNFLADINAVSQAIKTNLLLLKNEWWEDTSKGLPLFQNILVSNGSKNSIEIADLLIKDNILSTLNVNKIIDFESNFDVRTRTYTITKCEVSTSFGNITLSNITM